MGPAPPRLAQRHAAQSPTITVRRRHPGIGQTFISRAVTSRIPPTVHFEDPLIGSDEYSGHQWHLSSLSLRPDAGNSAFEAVLSYLDWRGRLEVDVALLDGWPYYFDCQFF